MAESQAVLNRRLRDIYKMGPLHTFQVLIGASSFTDLINRYRYLQRIAAELEADEPPSPSHDGSTSALIRRWRAANGRPT